MADIDINPFGEHGRTEEPMYEHILWLPQQEDQLGKQNEVNKKHHLEGCQVRV